MPKRGDKEFLLDIIEAIKRIELYTKELSYQDFLQKIETQDAVIRNFEIIGEAVKNISKNLKAKYNNLQWKEIAGMRDKVIYISIKEIRPKAFSRIEKIELESIA